MTRVVTFCHTKLTQITALEQKHFDLRSLSPALRNLWLLLVIMKYIQLCMLFCNLINRQEVLTLPSPNTPFCLKLEVVELALG